MTARALISAVVAAMLAAVAASSALASASLPACNGVEADDQIIVSGSVHVHWGERVGEVIVVDSTDPTLIDGVACGDVIVVSGDLQVTGAVEGDVVAISETPRIGPRASVTGDVVYGSGDKPLIPPGASVGGEVSELGSSEIGNTLGGAALVLGILIVIGLALSSLVLGSVLVWLFPRAADALMKPAHKSIGPSIGWGAALFLGLPIVGILVLVTVVGIPFGVFILLALVPLYVVGHITSQWLVGRSIVGPPHGRALSFLAGWAILNVAALVPLIGPLIGLAATVYGLGVLAVAAWSARQPGSEPSSPGTAARSTSPVPVPPPPSA